MGECYITRRGTRIGEATEQLGIYPTGNDGRPMGNVNVLGNVTNLSFHLFRDNKNILSVLLPDNLRSIEDYAFQNCTSLQEIDIPDRVSIIPSYCFDGDSFLSRVKLPKKLTTIKTYAFNNCSNLYNLEIPNDVGDLLIEGYAFSGCNGLDNETITKLATQINETVYPYAFANLTGITEVTTNYVAGYYFNGCTNLQKLTILNPLNSGGFGEYIINNCSNCKEVVLPDDATVLSANMFRSRSSLQIVNIPISTITIETYALYGTQINNINLPSSLTTIGNYSFANCSKLTSINIPSSCKTIGEYAFNGDPVLKEVVVDEEANYVLGQYAFANCTSLTNDSVHNIMEHYSTINSYVFRENTGLTNVDVSRFWTGMFYGCTNLISAKSTRNSNTGNDVFYNCTKLQEVYIAGGTSEITIGTRVFYGCTSLKTVYLPSSITTATNSSLTSTSSSYYVFYNCTALEDVRLEQDWNMSLRLNISNNLTIESMVAMFEALKDLTGATKKTLTLGSTNLGKLTDEQKAIATNKNWTLA